MSDRDTSIFNTDGTIEPQGGTSDQDKSSSNNSGDYADLLSNIKNDDGQQKYKDVKSALNALGSSQDHIRTLEQENSQYKEQVSKGKTIDDVLEAMTADKGQHEQTVQTGLGADDVNSAIEAFISQREATQTFESNQGSVANTLSEVYGDKAEGVYIAKAQELGMTVDQLNQLAGTAPKAALAYFGTKAKGTTSNAQGSVNTEALANQTEEPQPKKQIMYGASSSDVLAEWNRIKQETLNEINGEG